MQNEMRRITPSPFAGYHTTTRLEINNRVYTWSTLPLWGKAAFCLGVPAGVGLLVLAYCLVVALLGGVLAAVFVVVVAAPAIALAMGLWKMLTSRPKTGGEDAGPALSSPGPWKANDRPGRT